MKILITDALAKRYHLGGETYPYHKKKNASPDYNLLVCKPELAREFHPVKMSHLLPRWLLQAVIKSLVAMRKRA